MFDSYDYIIPDDCADIIISPVVVVVVVVAATSVDRIRIDFFIETQDQHQSVMLTYEKFNIRHKKLNTGIISRRIPAIALENPLR